MHLAIFTKAPFEEYPTECMGRQSFDRCNVYDIIISFSFISEVEEVGFYIYMCIERIYVPRSGFNKHNEIQDFSI